MRTVSYQKALLEISEILLKHEHLDADEIERIKLTVTRKYGLTRVPKNSEVLQQSGYDRRLMVTPLKIKQVRNISGISVIAVMSKPLPCPPQAQCIYCPGGVDFGSPKSYTGKEPAAMRGAQNNYDPFMQVRSRVGQLEALGHRTSKSEVVVMGGTFLSFPDDYQRSFIKGVYDGLNGDVSESMEAAMEKNVNAARRCVGLTFETRPDFCRQQHVDLMLDYGATRVELGVQILDDKVLLRVHRGNTVKDIREAFRVAKDAGFKIVAHMMPGLPFTSPERDLASFKRLFFEDDFKPDMLKIYPTLVIRSAKLYDMYFKGLYRPLDEEGAVELLAKVKEIVPPWIRIMRIQRDIPAYMIEGGVTAGNLRELVHRKLKADGKRCNCIRCREVGLNGISAVNPDSFRMKRIDYPASGGSEVFLSWEDEKGHIAGFLRLRIPSDSAHREEIRGKDAMLIRELRVYGKELGFGERDEDQWQHRGIGKNLMEEAERIAREEFGGRKAVVISAVGTRAYYQRLGYYLEGPYMVKRL